MQIHIDPGGAPVFSQIVQQVKYLIASGRLRPGDELPPIRTLAERLVINPNTVARAYRALADAGFVVKNSTIGTFIAADVNTIAPNDFVALTQSADELLAHANSLGIGVGELCELLRERHRATETTGAKS